MSTLHESGRFDIPPPNPGAGEAYNPEWVREIINAINRSPFLPAHQRRSDKARLAGVLDDTYQAYIANGGGIYEFSEHVRPILERLNGYHGLDEQDFQASLPGKRQPTFSESILATIDRYKILEAMPVAFGGMTSAIILGGSMSYGPFFNVRSGADSSDVDCILVLDDNFTTDSDKWLNLIRCNEFDKAESFGFLSRLEEFKKLYTTDNADIISQRFHFTDKNFTLSTHFFPHKTFDRVYGRSLEKNLQEGCDSIVTVRDFRSCRFARSTCEFYGMSGDRFEHQVQEQQTVQSGFIAELPAYAIQGGRYYPGIFQSLLLPRPNIIYSRDTPEDVNTGARLFSETIRRREAYERQFSPFASILNTEPRRLILPPGRY